MVDVQASGDNSKDPAVVLLWLRRLLRRARRSRGYPMTTGYRYFVVATRTERGWLSEGDGCQKMLWRCRGTRWERLHNGWWHPAAGPPCLVEIDPPPAERLPRTSNLATGNPAGGQPRFLPLFAYCMLTSSMILTVGAALHIELEHLHPLARWSITLTALCVLIAAVGTLYPLLVRCRTLADRRAAGQGADRRRGGWASRKWLSG